MSALRHRRDAVVGVLYLVAGTAFVAGSLFSYELGTGARMGPGYFPLLLGIVLAALGAIVLLRSAARGAPLTRLLPWDLRSLFWMVGAVMLFGLTLRPLGLLLSVVLLVLLSSRASHEFRWRPALTNAAILAALNLGLFVHGLGLPFPVLPAIVGP